MFLCRGGNCLVGRSRCCLVSEFCLLAFSSEHCDVLRRHRAGNRANLSGLRSLADPQRFGKLSDGDLFDILVFGPALTWINGREFRRIAPRFVVLAVLLGVLSIACNAAPLSWFIGPGVALGLPVRICLAYIFATAFCLDVAHLPDVDHFFPPFGFSSMYLFLVLFPVLALLFLSHPHIFQIFPCHCLLIEWGIQNLRVAF